MATVMMKVTNHDTEEYTEEFKGKMLNIPAGEYIVLPKSEANSFLATMAQDSTGRLKKKVLSAEPLGEQSSQPIPFICAFCGKEFETAAQLKEHCLSHAQHLVKEELEEPKGNLKCPFCEYSTDTEVNLKRHLSQKCMKR